MISFIVAAVLFGSDAPRDPVVEKQWVPNYVTAEESIQDDCMGLNKINIDRGGVYLMNLGPKPICGKYFQVKTLSGKTYASTYLYRMGSTFYSTEYYVTFDESGRPMMRISNTFRPLS